MINKLKSLKNDQGFLKYFKNTSWLLGEKILRMVVGLFVGIWVIRYLGPERFGVFSYAGSFAGLFSTIATLGLNGIVVRELVKDESKRDLLIGTAFWLKLLGAFAVLIILWIAINFTSNDTDTNIIMFIIASATIFQSFNVIDMYFQSKVMSKFIVYANTISLFFSSIIKVILILNEAPLIAFVWVVLFDSFALACGLVYFYVKNNLSLLKWRFDKIMAVSMLKDSWPLILSGMVITIYMKIDQIMIQSMLGNAEVGQYAAAVRLSEAWYFIPMLISTSLFPAILNAKKVSEELYYARLQKLYNFMIWFSIIIAGIMTFMSDWVIELLYGAKYAESSGVLIIYIWAGIEVFFGVANSKWILTENLQKYRLLIDGFGAVLNVGLNLLLIPLYGIYGAAFATLISYFGTFFIIFSFVKKLRIALKMFFVSIFYPYSYLKGVLLR